MGSSFGDDDDRQCQRLSEEGDRDRQRRRLSEGGNHDRQRLSEGDHDHDRQRKRLSEEGDRRKANWVSKSDNMSIVTIHSNREDKDKGRSHKGSQGDAVAVIGEFEQKLDKIATEYKKSLQDYYNKELTLEVEKSRARIEELNVLLKESVAREKKMSTEIKEQERRQDDQLRALALLREKDKEIANLQKQLKDMKGRGEKLEKENQKMRQKEIQKQVEISTLLEKDLTKIDKSLQKVSAEIQSLKSKVKGEEAVDVSIKNAMVDLHRYYNKHLQDHFYTTDWTELRTGKFGYVHEGVIGRVFNSPVGGTVPLFRFWNGYGKNHAYTRNKSEFDGGKEGYVYDGISCYIFTSPEAEAEGELRKPLIRFYSQLRRDHLLMTGSRAENGYVEDGILGYIF